MREKKLLWQNIPLPPWNPRRLFDLFQKHVAAVATPDEKDEYARQMMVYIAANLGRKKWFLTLRRCHLDPDDVAADLLIFLLKKTPSIHLHYPCVRVLLKVLNVAIFRRLISEIRQQKAIAEELPASDWCDEDASRFSFSPEHQETPFIEMLQGAMRDAEETICQGQWADQISICVLYRFLCRQIVRQNTILTYNQLPPRLARRITLEEHATVSYRLNKFICQTAAAYL
ncbi:MAG: hypothetical protein ACM359_20625 [Bacillota bacterium]